MRFKNKTGWIHEELEKKNECLNANEFGGENPEDVEKQREENDKEINKRFDGVRKTLKKVVGDDHEEHAKPHKVEEHFKTRKELAEATKELKDSEIKFTVNRSTKEGFRYVLEYFTTARIKKDEPLFEKLELDEGTISGAKELSYDELANLEKSLWDKLNAEGIYPEDGTFSNSSNKLADLDLEMVIDGDWKHDHLFAQHLVVDWCNENGYVIIRHTEEVTNDTGRDDYEAEHHWFLIKDVDGKMGDIVNGFKRMFSKDEEDESLKEDLPDAIPEEPLIVSTDVAPEVPAEIVPDEVVQTGIYSALSSELRDTLADIENLKSLTVTLVDEGREDIVDDLNTIIDDRTIHVGMLQTLMEKVDAKVEDAPVEDKPIEEPVEEDLNEYAPLKDRKQHKVFVEGDRVKYVNNDGWTEGGERNIGETGVIIDRIYQGNLEIFTVKRDTPKEYKGYEDTTFLATKDNLEFIEEDLKEAVDIHIEGNDVIVSKDLEEVAIIPVDGEEEPKEESLNEEWQYCNCKDLDEVAKLSDYCAKNDCKITAKTPTNDGYKCRIEGPFDNVHKVNDKWSMFKWRGTPLEEDINEKPWFMQQGDNGEPEYIGFAKSHDDMLDKMVKSHASDSIGENTYINELDKDTYEYIKKDLSDDEVKELDNYFKN